MTASTGLDGARDLLARLNREIRRLEHETRDRIERMSGFYGDSASISRREWANFHETIRPMCEERDRLIATLAHHEILRGPRPMTLPKDCQLVGLT